MPRLLYQQPRYRKHKSTGQAVVSLDGQLIFLGRFGSAASREKYDRLIAEWLANGRRRPPKPDDLPLTVVELISAYRKHAQKYYRKNGQVTREAGCIDDACRILRQLYGRTPANDFGPLALEAVRNKMVETGWTRKYINKQVGRLVRMFRWGASREMILASVPTGLATLEGLKKGRTDARETKSVQPIAEEVIQATLHHLPKVVADLVRFQRYTGCRPIEACIVRPCDIDRSGEVWFYRPESHKTEHQERERVICIGPKTQAVLTPYLLRPAEAYCFSPSESERHRRAEMHANRKTPLSCGNRPGTNKQKKPKRPAGDRYTAESYRRAIHRACELANLEKWAPNRLRHSAGTEIRRRYGLEAAQTVLGHSQADVTQIYAERDLQLATKVAREVG
jgi:integrase